MEFQTLTTTQEFQALAAEWNDLLAASVVHVPFLRHEYLLGWWETRGGGEWMSDELRLVTARQEGVLVGVAPLFLTQNRDAKPALMLLGSIEISDYLDVLVRPEQLPAFADGLLTHLAQSPDWQVLDWYNVLSTSPILAALQAGAGQRGWLYASEHYQPCPHILLPGDWEQYLAEQVDKKQRHEIRRKMRRAEESDVPVKWYIVEDGATLHDEVDGFLALMEQDAEKARFLTPAMRQCFHCTAQAAFDNGWLQLAFITVDGQKACGYFNFDYDNQIWVYNSGIDFSFQQYSPGWVLLGYLLQWANEHKRAAFDFMRGNEEYKYRFGAVDREVLRVQVSR
jgi:CelD/BcsL family acetyltransferase involved in cellulose biosynthesis